MAIERFTGTIEAFGSRMGVALPFDPNSVWRRRTRHHVAGSVNQLPFRGELVLEGAGYCLVLGPAWCRDHGTAVGDAVQVELAPGGHLSDNVAPDIAEALAADPRARDFFDSLPSYYRNNFMRWIDGAKRPATRAERIRQTVDLCAAGRRER